MTFEEAEKYRYNPFDLTKVGDWPGVLDALCPGLSFSQAGFLEKRFSAISQ